MKRDSTIQKTEEIPHRPRGVVMDWLLQYGFPVLEVASSKPVADAYVDDRGVRFDGDYERVWAEIQKKPWWKSLYVAGGHADQISKAVAGFFPLRRAA